MILKMLFTAFVLMVILLQTYVLLFVEDEVFVNIPRIKWALGLDIIFNITIVLFLGGIL